MTEYHVDKVMSVSVLGVSSEKYGRQIWTLAKLKKGHRCAICNLKIIKGEEAFRPLTNLGNRMERVHRNCFLAIINKELHND